MANFTRLSDVSDWVAEHAEGVNHLRHALAIKSFNEQNDRMARSWLTQRDAEIVEKRDSRLFIWTVVAATSAVVAAVAGLIAAVR